MCRIKLCVKVSVYVHSKVYNKFWFVKLHTKYNLVQYNDLCLQRWFMMIYVMSMVSLAEIMIC